MQALSLVDIVGWAATVAVVLMPVLQVVHLVRTRDVSGLSPIAYAIYVAGAVLWLAYGLILHDRHLLYTNLGVAACGLVILSFLTYARITRAEPSLYSLLCDVHARAAKFHQRVAAMTHDDVAHDDLIVLVTLLDDVTRDVGRTHSAVASLHAASYAARSYRDNGTHRNVSAMSPVILAAERSSV